MAKLQYGPIVTSASGKVAGVVFSIWKGVQYVKRWVKPTYTNTTAQAALRAAFALLCQQWKYLSPSTVLAWTNYAKGKGMANRNAWLGENTTKIMHGTIQLLTPHNPALWPPTVVTFSSATAGYVQTHFIWPAGYTTGDKSYFTAVKKTDKFTMADTSGTYPATVATLSGLTPATTYQCHVYLAATPNHERSMSFDTDKMLT